MQGFKPSGGLTIKYLQRIFFVKITREGENVPRGILGRADWPRVNRWREFKEFSLHSFLQKRIPLELKNINALQGDL